jgi:hypothetical protein
MSEINRGMGYLSDLDILASSPDDVSSLQRERRTKVGTLHERAKSILTSKAAPVPRRIYVGGDSRSDIAWRNAQVRELTCPFGERDKWELALTNIASNNGGIVRVGDDQITLHVRKRASDGSDDDKLRIGNPLCHIE